MKTKLNTLLYTIKHIGYVSSMSNFDKQRLGIFNIMNVIGILSGIIITTAALNGKGHLPTTALVVAISPFFISSIALISNYFYKHQFALLWYFILYPSITSLVYLSGIDAGIELLFILYAILSVFFLQKIRLIICTIAFTITCYFIAFAMHDKFDFVMKEVNLNFYIANQLLAIFLICYGLILVKVENNNFQKLLGSNNTKLQLVNTELKKKRIELTEQNYLLEEHKTQLLELNLLKTKMFSIISHDLRNPIYGLLNLFKNVQQYDLPGNEIKILIPDILNDLNYTVNLTENLLLWAKSQMNGEDMHPQNIDIAKMIVDTKNLMRLQAESKAILLEVKTTPDTFIYADKDMIQLVLRNLVSNAIKFTPNNGTVQVSTAVNNNMVVVYVQDNGIGISQPNLTKIFEKKYYSTNGTANEAGTGLGLMLCKEFLEKNGGDITVSSIEGKGSTFIFKLPICA